MTRLQGADSSTLLIEYHSVYIYKFPDYPPAIQRHISGPKTNLQKLSSLDVIFLGSGLILFKMQLAVRKAPLPFKYLGAILPPSWLRRADWQELLGKIKRKLEGWKGKPLSEGRLTLTKALLETMPNYIMSS